MPHSTTNSLPFDAAAPAVSPSPPGVGATQVDGRLASLRAELAAMADSPRQARLLAEIAEAEEQARDHAAALRDYLAAHQADPSFREPLESLSRLVENDSSFSGLLNVFDALVESAVSPDQRVRSLLTRGLHQLDRLDDVSAAMASVREATAVEGAAVAERASAYLALELLAGRTGDAAARDEALAERAQTARDPTWHALLLIDRARMAAAAGEVDEALSLLGKAKGQNSRATWTALVVEGEMLREHPGIHGTAEALARTEQRALALDAMATLVRTALADAAWGDALGLPHWVREPGRAVDLWLTAAEAQRDLGKLDAAATALASAEAVVDAMEGPDQAVAQTLVVHARIRLADLAGDRTLAASLAQQALALEADGPNGGALALRIAELAASDGDSSGALRALSDATRRDPACLPARALQLDVLAVGSDMTALAAELESLAEQLETDEARGRTFLLAAYAWAALAGDASSAKAALIQASMFGASTEATGYLARMLASLRGDAGWYEDATKRLFASRAEASVSLGLELVALRDARGDLEGAAKALRDLREIPGGAWPAQVLEAFSPPAPGSVDAPASKRSVLEELWAQETDPQWATSIGVSAAMRAHAEGDTAGARGQLREIARRRPNDVTVATFLGDLDRDAGDHEAAAKTALEAATAASDPDLAAAFYLESGLEKWRSGHRGPAALLFESAASKAPAAAGLMLAWARWGVDADNPDARRRALDDAAQLHGGDRALSLERFATEVAVGDSEAAARALAEVDAGPDDALALAAALARLAWPDAAADPQALERAVERVGAQGTEAALTAAAESLRIARESQDTERVAEGARAWFDAGGGLPAALEWIGAAVLLGDARQEIQARLATASCLSGDGRAAVMASAALLHSRVDFDQPAPLMPGESSVVRLANLELSPPGGDPRRRAAVLQEVGDVLGDDAQVDALALAAWSLLVVADVDGAQAAFEGVIAARPDDLSAWEGVRACAEQNGDVALGARACAEVGRLCADASRGAAFWEQAALAWLELGDDVNAEQALEASFSLDATRAVAFDKLFRRLRERKDPKLLAVISRRLGVTDDSTEIQKLSWEQARALREGGDQEGALLALEHVTMLDPNHVGALALVGEINIRRGRFEEAATALARLALLDTAPAKSRVTAGVAAVDLYENKLNRFDKSVEVLLALHRAGISTLPVRERLARVAARGGAWAEATAILEELMRERPDSAGRSEAARLAMAIHRDRLSNAQGAAVAIVKLLEEAPSDPEALEMLRQTSHPDDVRANLLASARQSLVAKLQRPPTDVATVRQLAMVARDLGDPALERATLGVLACLGAGDAESARTLARLAADAPRGPQVAISDSMMRRVVAPGDEGPIADLFALLGPTLAEALGPNLQSCGVGRRDKVDPRSGLSLRNEIASWAGAFGWQELDLYVGGNDPLGIQGVAGDPPSMVVGANINAPLSPVARARIARELLAVVRGTTVARWRDDVSIAAIVVAACRLADVAIDHPPYAVLAEIEKLVGKALPRRTRKAMTEICRAIATGSADARAWSRRALASHDRIAVIACGDPAIVLSDITGASVENLGSAIARDSRAEELVRYVLSQDYLDARAALGLEISS